MGKSFFYFNAIHGFASRFNTFPLAHFQYF